jgi:hypothetical protein
LFTSPWATSSELEDRHANIIPKLAAWPIDFTDASKPIDKALLFLVPNPFNTNEQEICITCPVYRY